MHPAEPGDTYLDDGIQYRLSVELRAIVTEPMHSDKGHGGHSRHGGWWWANAVPSDAVIEPAQAGDFLGEKGANYCPNCEALAKEVERLKCDLRYSGRIQSVEPIGVGESRDGLTDDEMRQVRERWDEFIRGDDGQIDEAKLYNELHDLAMATAFVSIVYCHITGGRVSKWNTWPSIVCDLADEHCGELLDDDEEVERLRGEWVPVSERLPEPEVIGDARAPFVPCIFFVPRDGIIAGRLYPYRESGEEDDLWESLQGAQYTTEQVTHWMPLPAPPEEKP